MENIKLRKGNVLAQCNECEVHFVVQEGQYKSRMESNNGKIFCSPSCFTESRVIKTRPRIKTSNTRPMVTTNCAYCNKEFQIQRKRIKENNNFCTFSCRSKLYNQKREAEGFYKSATERFYECVDKESSPSGCWLWIGSIMDSGYGRFYSGHDGDKRYWAAHRYSFRMHNPFTPMEGLFVCHHCDTPRCVRPSHLFLGTNSDNMKDCVAKLRWTSPTQKITREEAVDIKTMIKNNVYNSEILKKYTNLNSNILSKIRHSKIWADVEPKLDIIKTDQPLGD